MANMYQTKKGDFHTVFFTNFCCSDDFFVNILRRFTRRWRWYCLWHLRCWWSHFCCLRACCDCASCCCWRPISSRPDVLTVAGLPDFGGVPVVVGVSAVGFIPAVAGVSAVAGVPGVDGVLAVVSLPILASLCYCSWYLNILNWTSWHNRLSAYWTQWLDCNFFLLSELSQCWISDRWIRETIGLSDQGLNLSDYWIPD